MARTLVVSNCAVERAIHGPGLGPGLAPRSSPLSSFQLPSLVVLKTLLLPLSEAGLGGGLRLGAAWRGGASATPLYSKHLALGSRNLALCPPVPLPDRVGRFQEEQAGLCPSPGAARGRVVGGTTPLCSRAWEVARGRRAFRELFPPPGGGGTLGAARESCGPR